MNIKCMLGFHKWFNYTKKIPIVDRSFKITTDFRYCMRCDKNQYLTQRPSVVGSLTLY